ncbi:TetR family transcriptional regulator [Nonomuraea sp. NPDC049709]|uniref:TetR family transcriptional regulator n=1 Tax=Nonomuraea sp. NPDC049709 TaxID=3154736 RepID=UPI00341C7E28
MAPRRRRRSPEESRAELLAAAAGLIRERGPDNVSLRQIAEAAGVAHGLVTHYFGTYAALVREVLRAENDRIEERIRERIRAEQGVPTAAGIMEVLFGTLADERYLRLFVWAEMHADYRGAARPELVELIDAIEAGIRKGEWVAPRAFTSLSMFGGGEIDLRDARFADHEIKVRVFALWGYAEVTVPDDVEVEVKGFGLFGGFDRSAVRRRRGAPRVVISGLALFGGVGTRARATRKVP